MKGIGLGGKRHISIPGFAGYVTRKLNPERRERKRRMREDYWQRNRQKELDRKSGLSTVVRSSPCLIPDNGRVAQARQLDASWNEPENERQRKLNRCQTKIRGNHSLKKKKIAEFGSLHLAIVACASS